MIEALLLAAWWLLVAVAVGSIRKGEMVVPWAALAILWVLLFALSLF